MAFNQPCDSYFVEDQDAGYDPRSAQEYLKMVKRNQEVDVLSQIACDEYLHDIVKHMKQMEDDTLPDVASIDIQEEIQWFMRPYLVDFLIEAHGAFQLLPETLFLAVNLLDRYCSRRVVYKRHYQLVGCAALLIAAKYGDKKERVPMIKELKSMCCHLYDDEMFTQMEWHVLNTLDWVIGHSTIDAWMQIAGIERGDAGYEDHNDAEIEHMAIYMCEMALYHKDFVSTRASHMACASLALARGVLGHSDNTDEWEHTLNMTLVNLSQVLNRPSTVLARKYSSPHLSRVATTLDRFLMEQAAIQRRANPTPPPCEPQPVEKPVSNSNVLSTPQKGQYGNMVNGYLTPPITPDGEYFMVGQEAKRYAQQVQAPRYPVTPSPSQGSFAHQQQYNPYQ